MTSKNQFFKKYSKLFKENYKNNFYFEDTFIASENLDEITRYNISTKEELEKLLSSNDEEAIQTLHNQIMGFLFGDGEDYQSSFEETSGSGDFCWYLDQGDVEICADLDGFKYKRVRFWKDG